MATVEPFDVAFPVKFYSGGDTTKEAFGKHIQEIKRIYGIINAVNADKVSASELTDKFNEINRRMSENNTSLLGDLQTHIDSATPHPNYRPSFDDISGRLPTSRLTGKLPLRVVEPPYEVFVDDPDETVILIPDGIEDYRLGVNGYVSFGNGLIIQWGVGTAGDGEGQRNVFPKSFPNRCFMVVANICDTNCGYCNAFNYDRSGFYVAAAAPYLKAITWLVGAKVSWIAIGN